MNNENFKGGEFATFKNEAGLHSFKMAPQKWIINTNAIGMISKSGRYDGGTFAHPDIAFEFASWLSPEFKIYVITEFQRLKRKENLDNKLEWHAGRLLTKINYVVQTNAIKCDLVPTLTQNQKKYIYASEADLLNVALFGMTAKEWKCKNPNSSIRDNANLLQLIVLNNLENINAELIKLNMSQEDRLIRLNKAAKEQIELLNTNSTLENFSDQKLLIEKEII